MMPSVCSERMAGLVVPAQQERRVDPQLHVVGPLVLQEGVVPSEHVGLVARIWGCVDGASSGRRKKTTAAARDEMRFRTRRCCTKGSLIAEHAGRARPR